MSAELGTLDTLRTYPRPEMGADMQARIRALSIAREQRAQAATKTCINVFLNFLFQLQESRIAGKEKSFPFF